MNNSMSMLQSIKITTVDKPAYFKLHTAKSCDPDQHAAELSGWQQTYDQLSPGMFKGELTDCWFSDLQIFREITNQSVQQIGTSWKQSRTFLIPYAMDGLARWGHGCTEFMDMESAVTLSGNDELDFRTSNYLDLLAVSINVDTLADYSLLTDGVNIETKLTGKGRLPSAPAQLRELRSLLASIFDMLHSFPHIFEHSAVQKVVQQSLMSAVIGAFSSCGDEIAYKKNGRRSQSHYRTVAKAKQYIIDNLDEAITMTDLCRELAVSRRTLHSCFIEVTGCNPVQYLRNIRLNHVRRELRLAPDGHTKVQDVAAKWGFWHLGHFSSEYKRMFGEQPSETLKRSLKA